MADLNLPTTQLEAVNTILSVIGEAPVSTLNGAVTEDVTITTNTLTEVNRAVQRHGWFFNTEINYPLVPDTSGTIRVPLNTLRIVIQRNNPNIDPVYRGGILYDRISRSTNFTTISPTGVIASRLVLFLDFEDLPDSARRYITIHAARLFQQRVQSSALIEQFTATEEMAALRELMSDASATESLNVKQDIGIGQYFNRFI
jgi:hypothetical protein